MNTLAFAIQIENTTDKIHLVIASTVGTAKAVVEDGDGLLGLSQYFSTRYRKGKYKGIECGYIKTSKGEKIVLYLGGSMESSYKAFRGISAGCIILEEANLLHENTINEAKGRNLMASNRKFFISMNPTNSRHPIYKWLEELERQNIVNYNHSTLYQNPALTEERRNEIIAEFDPSSNWYKQYILGERVDAEGQIYNVRDYNILQEWNPNDYLEFCVCCDQGESISASVFQLAGLYYNKEVKQYEIHILKEYYYINSGKNENDVKMLADTAEDYANFILECENIIHASPMRFYIDQDVEFYRNCKIVFREKDLNTNLISYVIKDDIEQRVKTGVNLLYKGKLRFYKECKNTIEDFKNAVYDQKKIESKGEFQRLKEYSTKGHLDSIDCTEYLFSHYKKRLYEQ